MFLALVTLWCMVLNGFSTKYHSNCRQNMFSGESGSVGRVRSRLHKHTRAHSQGEWRACVVHTRARTRRKPKNEQSRVHACEHVTRTACGQTCHTCRRNSSAALVQQHHQGKSHKSRPLRSQIACTRDVIKVGPARCDRVVGCVRKGPHARAIERERARVRHVF